MSKKFTRNLKKKLKLLLKLLNKLKKTNEQLYNEKMAAVEKLKKQHEKEYLGLKESLKQQFEKDRQQFEIEKQQFEKEKEEVEKLYQITENIIELNVGGDTITTLKTTLTSIQGSMLCAMFSGRHTLTTDKQGRYFIDRNPKYFRMILEALRTGNLPNYEPKEKDELLREMDYFGLQELFPPLIIKYTPNSTQGLLYNLSLNEKSYCECISISIIKWVNEKKERYSVLESLSTIQAKQLQTNECILFKFEKHLAKITHISASINDYSGYGYDFSKITFYNGQWDSSQIENIQKNSTQSYGYISISNGNLVYKINENNYCTQFAIELPYAAQISNLDIFGEFKSHTNKV